MRFPRKKPKKDPQKVLFDAPVTKKPKTPPLREPNISDEEAAAGFAEIKRRLNNPEPTPLPPEQFILIRPHDHFADIRRDLGMPPPAPWDGR